VLAELATELDGLRGAGSGPFDLVAEIDPGDDPQPWADAGATWVLESLGQTPSEADARAVIAGGP
jgi:hypothetical protein